LGHIEPFDPGSTIAEDQLFFLGGTTNVRGFDENMLVFDSSGDPAGGKTMAHATVESRISITKAIELSIFLDSGQVKNMANNSRDRGIRSTLGMGFNYITPIGPVSLMYGYKLDKKENESDGEVHFSIGYTF
jgi:outer membrane protein insertion porin family